MLLSGCHARIKRRTRTSLQRFTSSPPPFHPPRQDEAKASSTVEFKGPMPEVGTVFRDVEIKGVQNFGVFVEILPGLQVKGLWVYVWVWVVVMAGVTTLVIVCTCMFMRMCVHPLIHMTTPTNKQINKHTQPDAHNRAWST